MEDIFKTTDKGLIVNLATISKGYLNEVASDIIKSVMEGESDALHEYIKAKGLAELASIIIEGLKDEALSEADNYAKDEKVLGCDIVIKGTPALYDFSVDEEWVIIANQINELKGKLKARELKMIDALKYSNLVDENGEVIPKADVKKEAGTTLSVTIKK